MYVDSYGRENPTTEVWEQRWIFPSDCNYETSFDMADLSQTYKN